MRRMCVKNRWDRPRFLTGALFLFMLVLPLLLFGCRDAGPAPETTAREPEITEPETVAFVMPETDSAYDRLLSGTAAAYAELRLIPGDIILATGETLPDETRAHTPLFAVPNRVLRVEADPAYRVFFCRLDAGGGQFRSALENDCLFYAGRNASYALVAERYDGGALAETGEVTLRVIFAQEDLFRSEENGLLSATPFWGGSQSFFGAFALHEGDRVSVPIPLSNGGIGLLFGGDEESAVKRFRASAVRLTDDGIVPATQAALQSLNTAGSLQAQSLYIPETPETYLVLILESGADPGTLTLTGGSLAVRADQRLAGLFSLNMDLRETEAGAAPEPVPFTSANMERGQNWVGALLRTADVQSVVCGPRFELLAEYWDVDETGSLKKSRGIAGGIQPGGEAVRGASVLTPDPAAGAWMLLCVHRRAEPSVDAFGAYGIREPGMGDLRGYGEVRDGVSVTYAPGFTPGIAEITDPTLLQNLQDALAMRVPYVYAGEYFTPMKTTQKYRFPEMRDASLIWYGGDKYANTLFHNVSPRTYLTAAANPNSRFYGNYGYYGATCLTFLLSLYGVPESYPVIQIWTDPQLKFERIPFSFKTDPDALQPGDILIRGDPETQDGHAFMVFETVRTAGSLSAVTVLEGFPPFVRLRTFTLTGAVGAGSQLLRDMLPGVLDPYVYRLRVKPEYVRTLRESFEFPADISVGSVLCDRGSDAVYCMGATHAQFSVTDEAANVITVKNGDREAGRIPLAGALRKNGLRVVSFSHLLTEPGLYTVYTDASDDAQERFYVPAQQTGFRVERGEGETPKTVSIVAADLASLDSVLVYYKKTVPVEPETAEGADVPAEPDPQTAQKSIVTLRTYPKEALEPADKKKYGAGWGRITFPAEKDGFTYYMTRVVYRTPYGTYWIAYDNGQLVQSAELKNAR